MMLGDWWVLMIEHPALVETSSVGMVKVDMCDVRIHICCKLQIITEREKPATLYFLQLPLSPAEYGDGNKCQGCVCDQDGITNPTDMQAHHIGKDVGQGNFQ
jgi:hypothetical protein